MDQFLSGLVQLFISAFTSKSAKVLAKRMFSEKSKTTLTPEKRNKGGKSK